MKFDKKFITNPQYVVRICLLLATVLACSTGIAVAERQPMMGEVFRNGDGNWECRTNRYAAVVNGISGRLQNLVVEGKELLAQGETNSSGGQLYVDGKAFEASLVPMVDYNTIGAWDGNFGMWWHFRPDGIKLEYAVNKAKDPTLTFVLNPDVITSLKTTEKLRHRWLASHIFHEKWLYGEAGLACVSKLSTEIAFQGLNLNGLTEWNGRQAPAASYAMPQGKRAGAEIHIGPAVADTKAKAQTHFQGPRWHLFESGGKLQFSTTAKLASDEAKDIDVAVVLCDYNTHEILAELVQTVSCEPKRTYSQNWSVPWNKPGVFRGSVRARTKDGVIGERKFAFMYDLANWKPELYRTADFWDFWDRQLEAMRAQPLDAKVIPLPEKSNAAVRAFAVEITGCNGRRIKGEYSEPTKPGKFPVILSAPHPGKDLRVGATEPTVMVQGQSEDVAKYRLNIGDNTKSNFLHVYLDYVRWLDFADSRGKADWSRCFAPAGSRGGPMVIAGAALDKRIKLIWMNVATCNRWDWQVKYTSGWGPYMTDRMAGQSKEAFIKVLSYFDPSHFAERVTIPVGGSWGMIDGLSPLNGQLSMWVNLGGPRFLELRPAGGHDSHTPAFDKLGSIVRKKVFAGEPLPDTGSIGLHWDRLIARVLPWVYS